MKKYVLIQEKLKFYPCNNEKQFEKCNKLSGKKDFIYIKRLEERNHIIKQTFPNTFNSNERNIYLVLYQMNFIRAKSMVKAY